MAAKKKRRKSLSFFFFFLSFSLSGSAACICMKSVKDVAPRPSRTLAASARFPDSNVARVFIDVEDLPLISGKRGALDVPLNKTFCNVQILVKRFFLLASTLTEKKRRDLKMNPRAFKTEKKKIHQVCGRSVKDPPVRTSPDTGSPLEL